ncbi:helix-turn-helix domain-containing protein [Microscilla marina]|uniref:Uncharacterized protein n=1 Tax=Microscilla marina ATCC 23134 TaxID=313606 RepID=A1ZQG5_MICM2|nr:helix-turn-helix domain-containing protein [Microscilla marina]EAY27337.1 hypothetical protein M23134_08289 [Microscilla marina ATCC 23134]
METLEITKDTDIKEYRRQLIVRLSKHDLTQEEIADVVSCSQGLVSQTLQNYATDGFSGIAPVPHSGPTSGLDSSDLATLEQLLSKGASDYGYSEDYWDRSRVQKLISSHFGLDYCLSNISKILQKIRWS